MRNGRIVRVGRQRMTCHGCGQTVIVGDCASPKIQTHACGAAWLVEVTDDGKSRIEPLPPPPDHYASRVQAVFDRFRGVDDTVETIVET